MADPGPWYWGAGYSPESSSLLSSSASSASGLGGLGLALSIAGAGMGAVGSFYATLGQRNELKSRALSEEFEASTANINARAAEQDAQNILSGGQQEAGLASLRYGQLAGAQRAEAAASGVELGTGSAAEATASTELAKRIDMMTIGANALRSAGNARLRAAGERGRSMLALTSAANLRGGAATLNPWLAASTSLLGSALSAIRQAGAYSSRGY